MNKDLPFKAHFLELKRRILYVVAFFILMFITSYVYSEEIFAFLLEPLLKSYGTSIEMIYTELTEGFVTYLELAFFVAVLTTIPFMAIQIFTFALPGLKPSERKYAYLLLLSIPSLFFMGITIAYKYVFAASWKFFLSFESSIKSGSSEISIKLYPKISEYLHLALQIMFAFGIIFQLPIILILLNKIGLLSVQTLKTNRRIVIVIIFTIAAIVTPPDAMSQIILAFIMILLYEISILVCIALNRNK